MPEKILFLELFQPFAQYRNPFTFYYAQTYPLPPKSTIIGMLQNACDDWYGNKNGIENWWKMKVSIHGGFESIFWNYQNLIKGVPELTNDGIENQGRPLYGKGITSKRSPTPQQELFNGHLYVLIKGNDSLIDSIKNSIENLNKVISLGRSEDIVFIKGIKEVNPLKVENVEGDLKLHYPTYIYYENFPIANRKYPVYYIPIKVIFKNNNNNIKHKYEINKNTEREVDFKKIIYTGYDYSIIIEENKKINVEFYEINDKKIRISSYETEINNEKMSVGGWL
ncbi:MAG: CRISPR-associated protein Cas5 [Thermoplasmata archaeon]